MKVLLLLLIAFLHTKLTAQDMTTPKDVIIQLFVSTDQKDWLKVENCFAPKVLLDYSSMNGAPADTLSPTQITTAWKAILPGFKHTHHQIGNIQEIQNDDKTQVSCYGTATHYLNDEAGNTWTVVGSYDFELLQNSTGNWQIAKMTFNYKYQEGNTSLPQKAMEKAKLN